MIRRDKHKNLKYGCVLCVYESNSWSAYKDHTADRDNCMFTQNREAALGKGLELIPKSFHRYVTQNDVAHEMVVVGKELGFDGVPEYKLGMFVTNQVAWLMRRFKGDCLPFLLGLTKADPTFEDALVTLRSVGRGEQEAELWCLERFESLEVGAGSFPQRLQKRILALSKSKSRFDDYIQKLKDTDPDNNPQDASNVEVSISALEIMALVRAVKDVVYESRARYLR